MTSDSRSPLPSAPRSSGSRRHAPAPERRSQILEAALGCFSERGFHATTMDDLVRASGLSKGSLYWYFESKEAVFLALFDFLAEEIFGHLDAAAEQGDADVVSLLERELLHFFERFGRDERRFVLAWAEFLAHPSGRERMAALYRLSREKLAVLIRLGVERGEIRPVSPEGAAAMLTGTLDALILQAAVDPEFEIDEHVPALWDLVQHGLAPPEPQREAQPRSRSQPSGGGR